MLSSSLLDKEFSAQIRLACVFGNLGNEALVVTRDDEVNNMILYKIFKKCCSIIYASQLPILYLAVRSAESTFFRI